MRHPTSSAASGADRVLEDFPRASWTVRRTSVFKRQSVVAKQSQSIRFTAAEGGIVEQLAQSEHLPLEASSAGCAFENADSGGDIANSYCLKDHNFFQNCSFTTIGSASVKVHVHPLGLAQIIFNNCVVQVRLGHDFERLVALSRSGPVLLQNIQTNGWIATYKTLLPAFVFRRWMSSMIAESEVQP
jgi:hypothetical protein